MKKAFYLTALLGLLFSCSQTDEPEVMTQDEPTAETRGLFTKNVVIEWNEEGQELDGFGIAEADCAADIFTHPKRKEVMDLLFGKDGLNISILRGEIFPHYWMKEGDTSFDTDVRTDMPLGDPYFQQAEANELKRRGQLWVTQQAKQLYHVDKLFFSTWSPPAWMKQDGYITEDNFASHGSLKKEYYQMFADYLVQFVQAYKEAGMDIYAISPVNEPNYEANWNSCKWSPEQLADFIANYMGPTFEKQAVNPQIIFGELAQWSTLVLGTFNVVSAKKYAENVMEANPDVLKYADIAAGHGYNIPRIPYEFPIVPYDKAVDQGLKVWLTEISSALDNYDGSMDNAIHWAEVFHKYLTNAHVNAVCWWTGARYTDTNESLIKLEQGNFQIPKRFYTYGNYTRYVKVGSKQIRTDKPISTTGKLLLTAFKNNQESVMVAVNKSKEPITTTIQVKGGRPIGELKAYITDAEQNWKESTITKDESNMYPITVPAMSVVTYVGSVQ